MVHRRPLRGAWDGCMTEADQGPDEDAKAAGRLLLALADFEARQAQAATAFASAEQPHEKRSAVVSALSAAAALLVTCGGRLNAGPLFETIFALDALDADAVVWPLLRPGLRPRGQQRDSDGMWMQRAVVAAALEQRRRVSADLPEAAKAVARWLKAKGTTARTIRSWRSRLMEGPHEEPWELYIALTEIRADGGYVWPLATRAAVVAEMASWGGSRNTIKP